MWRVWYECGQVVRCVWVWVAMWWGGMSVCVHVGVGVGVGVGGYTYLGFPSGLPRGLTDLNNSP